MTDVKIYCPIDGSKMNYFHESAAHSSETSWRYICGFCKFKFTKRDFSHYWTLKNNTFAKILKQAADNYLQKVKEEYDSLSEEGITKKVKDFETKLREEASEKRPDLERILELHKKHNKLNSTKI